MDLSPRGEEAARLAEYVGAPLAAARTRQGLTMAELARRSGVGADGISKLERGRQRPSRATLHRLAVALFPFDQAAAFAFAERLVAGAGPSLSGDATMPVSVARELVVEILERAAQRAGLDVTDERVRAAVVASIREVTGGGRVGAIEAANHVRFP